MHQNMLLNMSRIFLNYQRNQKTLQNQHLMNH